MKWTIEWYGTLAGVQLDEHDHDLWALWMKCKAILLSVSGSDKVALIAVEQIVNEFQQWDKKATAFRYSRNKNGLTIPLPKRPIDLENMQRVMEAVDNFFKGADGLLSDMLSAAPDQF